MNILTIVFIAICAAMVIHYYYSKNKQEKLANKGTLACKETECAGKPSIMEVVLPQDAEANVKKFIHDNTDLDWEAHCKTERDNDRLKVYMDKDLTFYDTACIVNQFAWDADGLKYYPKAHYAIGKLQIGDIRLTNTEVTFFICQDDEPYFAHFTTKDGKEYLYDLSSERVRPLN